MAAQFPDEGRRHLDPQLSVPVDADGFVAAVLARLAVGAQKHPRAIPAVPPPLLVHVGGVEVVTVAPQPFPAHPDRRTMYSFFSQHH